MAEKRKIAAILAADVVGFSRLTGADEDRTLARLRALRSDLIDPAIAVHNGRVFKRTGDGALVEFRSVVRLYISLISRAFREKPAPTFSQRAPATWLGRSHFTPATSSCSRSPRPCRRHRRR